MPIFTSSLSSYQTYLRENLPEYALIHDAIPEPPQPIVLRLKIGTSMKVGSGAAPYATVQPSRLEFSGTARLGQIKHFRAKRDKIITYLSSDCPRKGLVLKKYNRWDSFTVGVASSADEDVDYQHLERLKADTADLTSGFMFFARCVLGMTTPEQKEAYIKKHMATHCPRHELVHFEHNNQFYIARKDTPTGLGSGGGLDMDGVHHFFSKRQGEWITVQGKMLTSMSELTAYHNAKTGFSFLDDRRRTALARAQVEKLEAAGIFGVGLDPFQHVVAEVVADMQASVLHDAGKSIKQALFGKHCRTHPVRATRMALSNLFRVLPGIVRAAGTKVASAAVTAAISHADSAGQAVSTAATAATGERPMPRWVQDAGLSPSDDELNQKHWKEIQDHLDSLDKWERRFGEIEHRVRTERREVVTCAQMDELLRCYAKIQFHLDQLLAGYEKEIAALNQIGGLVTETKASLKDFERQFKDMAVDFFNQKRAKLKKASTAVPAFTTGGAAYQTFRYRNVGVSEANMDSFLARNPELRGGPTDNDAAAIAAED